MPRRIGLYRHRPTPRFVSWACGHSPSTCSPSNHGSIKAGLLFTVIRGQLSCTAVPQMELLGRGAGFAKGHFAAAYRLSEHALSLFPAIWLVGFCSGLSPSIYPLLPFTKTCRALQPCALWFLQSCALAQSPCYATTTLLPCPARTVTVSRALSGYFT